jgi:ABC-type Fe3+ transport system substrate-binding protein
LTKKTSEDRVKPIVDYLLSPEVGQLLATNGKFPSTHPDVENGLKEGQTFLWLGWDFINTHEDLGALIRYCMDLFYDESGVKR